MHRSVMGKPPETAPIMYENGHRQCSGGSLISVSPD